MDLEKIHEMWSKDSKIDTVMIDEASIKIPQLHHKYLTLLSEYKLLLKKKELQLKTLKHTRGMYYSGRGPDDDEPFPYKLLKSEVKDWVDVDNQVTAAELKVEYYCATIDALERILHQVNQMSFNIRNVIEWRKFAGGL